jgi:hypothetical protein
MSLKRITPVVLSLFLVPSVALAEGKASGEVEVARTGLEFTAPEGCPSADEFKTKVQARAEGNEFVESDANRTFVVKIEQRGATFHGSFRVRRGGTTKRKVASNSCIEVSDALAVVAALSLVPLKEEEGDANKSAFVTTYGAADSSKAVVEESNLVATGDEPPQQKEAAADSFKKKKSRAPGRDLLREKELKKGHAVGIDLQAGATLGRYPESAAARFDLSLRTAALLQISEDAQYLWGFVPRLRGNVQPLSRIRGADYHIHISGGGFAVGGCYTPYFDPEGFRVFGCLDFGANYMNIDTLPVPGDDFADLEFYYVSPRGWSGVGTLSLESEFKIVSIFYAALRMGLQQDTKGSYWVAPGGPDAEPITISGTTFIASGGIGAHF